MYILYCFVLAQSFSELAKDMDSMQLLWVQLASSPSILEEFASSLQIIPEKVDVKHL